MSHHSPIEQASFCCLRCQAFKENNLKTLVELLDSSQATQHTCSVGRKMSDWSGSINVACFGIDWCMGMDEGLYRLCEATKALSSVIESD